MYRRKAPEYRYETFRRRAASGERIIYVRFLGESGAVIATRSTGTADAGLASAEIMRMIRELDLGAIEAAREDQAALKTATGERYGAMSVAEFLVWFWGPDSSHVEDMRAAGTPLSKHYLETARGYIRLYVEPYGPFRETALRDVSFRLIDSYFRAARAMLQAARPELALSRSMTDWILRSIRAALNWAAARGYCKAVDLSGIAMIRDNRRERGLVSDEEVARILSLSTQRPWREESGEKRLRVDVRPRPRLPGGARHSDDSAAIDVRMKAYVVLGLYSGMRRGEERGLRWGAVDLEAGILRVEGNYVPGDGAKAPKRGSYGAVPIAPELEVVLWELHELAEACGLSKPSDYVLFNPADPSKPMSESACRRGWLRVMRLIGISDAERERRHLVPHGLRHRFATKLVDAGLSPAEAAKLTRHKTEEMLAHYSGHVSAETMAKAVEAVRGRK